MALRKDHELHKRRFTRNMGVGLLLAGFVVLVMVLTIVKVSQPGFQLPQVEAGQN